MKIQKTFATLAAALALNALTLPAQVSTQELYTVKFRATCTPSDTGKGKGSKMTERDLIQELVGTGFTQKELKRNYALVYNPASDSLQVVSRTDGSLIGDVLIFDGGTNAIGGSQLSRFAFVFSPTQSEAIGSAVITERVAKSNNRARISGRIQFSRAAHIDSAAAASSESDSASRDTSSRNNLEVPNPDDSSGNTNSSGSNGNSSTINESSDTHGQENEGNNNDGGNGNGANGEFVQAGAAASAAAPGEVEICVGTFTAGKLFQIDDRNRDDEPDTGNAGGSNGDDNSNNDLNAADRRFVTQAAQNGLLEIELANLALQNSTNEAVRAYAQQLITDHTQANQRLAQIASDKGITVPTTLSSAGQNAVERLDDLSGAQFDRQFANQAVATHSDAIEVFENEVSRGDDLDLKSFAEENLPVLRAHLEEARALQSGTVL